MLDSSASDHAEAPATLQARFADMLARREIFLPRGKGTVHCLFHHERSPSLSIDVEKCVFHCFGCGAGGGVRDFAKLIGEPWSGSHIDSRATFARRARFHAEQQARAILQRRRDARLDTLFADLRPLWREAADCVELLGLFHRRPDLAEEFSTLAARAEHEYGDLLLKLSVLEMQLDEVVA